MLRNIDSARTFQWSVRLITAKFYVATKWNRRHAVIGVANLSAKEPRPKANGEGLDPDFEKLGDNKMAKFVQNNSGPKNEYERQDTEDRHLLFLSLQVISLAKGVNT